MLRCCWDQRCAQARTLLLHRQHSCRPVLSTAVTKRMLAAPAAAAAAADAGCSSSSSSSSSSSRVAVAVVGAGLTGATVAKELAAAGARVTVFDLGGAPGGRASSRTLALSPSPRTPAQVLVDHGLQALATPTHPDVARTLQGWLQAGLVSEWSSSSRVGWLDARSGQFEPRADRDAPQAGRSSFFGLLESPGPLYVGTPSMASLLLHELTGPHGNPITVHRRTRVERAKLASIPPSCTPASSATTTTTTTASNSRSGAGALGSSVWRLHGRSIDRQPPGSGPAVEMDLGCYHALVLTDSLAAKTGSPGSIQVDVASCDAAAAGMSEALGRVASLQRMPLFTLMLTFPAPGSTSSGSSGEGSSGGGGSAPALAEEVQQQQQQQQQQDRLLPFDAACVQGSAGIGWIALDSSKPARASSSRAQGPQVDTLIAITTPDFAAELLGAPTSAPLPPQTPQYLEERAQRMWKVLEQDLLRARGGRPFSPPLAMQLHRWGSACARSPLVLGDTACMLVTAAANVEGSSGASGSAGCGAALPAGTGGGVENGAAGYHHYQQQQQAKPCAFVVAGDFCVAHGGSLQTGYAAAVLSGIAAARAVVRTCMRP